MNNSPSHSGNYTDKESFQSLAECFQLENQAGRRAKNATQHLKLYHLVRAMDHPVVVECGVDIGVSNRALLTACEETAGHLYSIDIRDCSHVAKSPSWTFIQSDDTNTDEILRRAPELSNGIDFIHIDSLHTEKHVLAQINAWYPLVKQGGYLTFHDIDNVLYRPGQWRESRRMAIDNREVSRAVRAFFYANEDDHYLEYHLGVTGMAIMKKLKPMRVAPRPPAYVPDWPADEPARPGVKDSARMLCDAVRRSLVYRLTGR